MQPAYNNWRGDQIVCFILCFCKEIRSLQWRHMSVRAFHIIDNTTAHSIDCSDHPQTKYHYDDVIMTTMAAQITSVTVVYSTVYSDANQRNHQSSASLAFVWGIHRDRWIPRTNGQLRGKCFHLMTSSCQSFASLTGPFLTAFTDRWIRLTEGQQSGKLFPAMASSWFSLHWTWFTHACKSTWWQTISVNAFWNMPPDWQ